LISVSPFSEVPQSSPSLVVSNQLYGTT